MPISTRTAVEKDFLAMCKVDLASNATHPFYNIPWKATDSGAVKAFILDRYKHFYDSRNPICKFLVAVNGDEIVGYLLYQNPLGEGEVEEWKPQFPDGTNLKFFEKVARAVNAARLQYDLKDCWQLEGFAVHPNWQRKGVGSMLVRTFLESVGNDHAKCYVHASRTGKLLYEKFGFRTMGVTAIELQEFGDYEPYTTWDMQREAMPNSV